jgi:hypothetical protein
MVPGNKTLDICPVPQITIVYSDESCRQVTLLACTFYDGLVALYSIIKCVKIFHFTVEFMHMPKNETGILKSPHDILAGEN